MSGSEEMAHRARRICVLFGLLALAMILVPFSTLFSYPGVAMDEGTVLVYPELILKGSLPYRDFETLYAPGNLWTLAGAYRVFGANVTVERSVGLAYRLILLSGIFILLRRWSPLAAFGGTLVAALFLVGMGLVALAWIGGIACLLWSLLILSGQSAPWRAALAGLLGGVTLLYRVDLGPAMLISTLPLFLLLSKRDRWIFLAGSCVALLPMGGVMLAAGWKMLWENLFLYPVVICNPARRIPLSLASDEGIFLFCLHVGACCCNLWAGVLTVKADPVGRSSRLFLCAALFGTGLSHQGMQRADMPHIVLSVVISLALLPLGLMLSVCRGRGAVLPGSWAIATLAVLISLLGFGAPNLLKHYGNLTCLAFRSGQEIHPSAGRVEVRGREFPYVGIVPQTQSVVDFLAMHSLPGERLFVGTTDLRRAYCNDTFLYHLLPWLTPATYYLEFNPRSVNRPNSRLAADIASADWLILNRAWNLSNEPNLSMVPGSDAPNEVVRTRFDLRGRSGPYEVYYRKPVHPFAAAS